jgi:hypothetical protein
MAGYADMGQCEVDSINRWQDFQNSAGFEVVTAVSTKLAV